MFRNQYDTDVTTGSPAERLFQVEYAMKAVKQGSAVIVQLADKAQVEYKDYSLGKICLGVAEAPDEALPLNCRPNFSIAWLTKDRFKVNGTYDCWYSSSISKVSLYEGGFFNCQAKDLSLAEMIRRFFTL